MLSPASQHRKNASAGRSIMPATTVGHITDDTLKAPHHDTLIVGQFNADFYRMSHIKSRTRRVEAKRQALGLYQSWLDAFTQRSGWEGREANMFVWLMLWHIDVSDWRRAMELGRFALGAGMSSPKDFSRTLAETVSEEITAGILKAGESADYADVLESLVQLVEGHDMTDQISAKLHKARGLAMLGIDQAKAREHLLAALKLDSGSGVKRHLKALEANGKPKPTERHKPIDIKEFSLSGRAAARLANMTPPAFLRHAKKHPDLLQQVVIPVGNRNIYRFNPAHVTAYMKQHLVKTTCKHS